MPPVKVLWYLPIIPRRKRLLANGKDAKLLRWHFDERKKDGKLRHVVDSPQWRKINNKYDEFGGEIKNIRFGLSLDRINPFENMSSNHNTWPVLLCVYNLPHWLCMKRKYIMMSLLIEGPKQLGNDIDVYLAPLVVDLKTLWNKGIKVYDVYKKENFTLRAMIFNTISDFPAYIIFQGEIKACGPIFLRYIYPFERYMGILKGYIRIEARPEGSSVTGYLGEELIEFGNNVVIGVGNIGTIGLRKINLDRDALKWEKIRLQGCWDSTTQGEPRQNHQLLEKKNGLGNVDVRKRGSFDEFNEIEYTADPTTEYALISVFHSFPANLSSVMALSSSPYALPTYLSPPLLNILSLCLRSTFSAPVVLFYGIELASIGKMEFTTSLFAIAYLAWLVLTKAYGISLMVTLPYLPKFCTTET
ncbi:hypothetical protein Tco_0744197 [Tanacetum coccineum]